jgi:hypothetical protein
VKVGFEPSDKALPEIFVLLELALCEYARRHGSDLWATAGRDWQVPPGAHGNDPDGLT